MLDNPLKPRQLVALLALVAGTTLALGTVCVYQASDFLAERQTRDAEGLARLYADRLATRLNAAAEALRQAATGLERPGASVSETGWTMLAQFDTVTWVSAGGDRLRLQGKREPVADLARLQHVLPEDNTTALAHTGQRGTPPALVRRVPGNRGGMLIAMLAPDTLLPHAPAGDLPHTICLLQDAQSPLFCSNGDLDEAARRQIALRHDSASGPIEWHAAGKHLVGGYVRQPLRAPFAPAMLTAVAFGPETARAGAETITRRLAPWFALVAALAASAAVAIVLGARRAALPRPACPEQSPDGSPRGGVLVASPAAAEVERERLFMRALTEIDRAILSRAPVERVVDLALDAVLESVGDTLAAVTLLDRSHEGQARTYFAKGTSAAAHSRVCATTDLAALRALARDPEGILIAAGAAPAVLAPLLEHCANCLLVPVFRDASLAAVLSVALPNEAAADAGARSLVRDLADRLGVALTAAAREQDLYQQTHFDPVTALPNQLMLRERLAQEIARAQRESREFAVLYVDLDQFRKVTNSLGHARGDTVLEQAARRMRRCLRAEDVIARFSGDEFVVLLPALAKGARAARVAEKLIAVLSDPFVLGGEEHLLGACIGISLFPGDGRSADALLRNANFAMYRAKSDGRGSYCFFDEKMNAEATERAGIERDLRSALANGELALAYQPQIDLRSGRIIGAEALARWTHPTRGCIPPNVFIEIAEQGNLIDPLGKFVRATACAQYRAWQASGLALPRIAVNVSSREIRRSGFVDHIASLLDEQGLRPYSLEIEITESLLLDNSVIGTLRAIHELGVHLAIDDFGTGYSSMAYLKNLPFDVLKIDRSFVKDLGTDDGSEGVVNAILGVARSLGKDVIAEGVESEAQRALLASEGCEAGQGYLWSRPLPAVDFEKLLRNWIAVPHEPAVLRVAPRLASV